jgi:hypothetical protein
MSHTCKSLIIHCIDFRFQKSIKKFLDDKQLLGNCDILSIAGITKGFVSGESEPSYAYLLNQIDISHRLHGIKEIILLHHTDCGAYGGSNSFAAPAEEIAKYTADMRLAKEILVGKYQEISVKMFIAHLAEEIYFEEIIE